MSDDGISRVPVGQPTPRLDELDRRLERHRRAVHRPPSGDRLVARDVVLSTWRAATRPVVLDLGCGTGESTSTLATVHADAVVIGIDKSNVRLSRGPLITRASAMPTVEPPRDPAAGGARALVCRSDIEDVLAGAAIEGLRASVTYLLFPNPWPKPGHQRRRFYARPVVRDLFRVAAAVELRTNWRVYAQEAAHVFAVFDADVVLEVIDVRREAALSPFETKYRRSGHVLWRVRAMSKSRPR